MAIGSNQPIDGEIASAVARFFHGGSGPSHTVISRILMSTNYSDDYSYSADKMGPTKESRVIRAFQRARRQPINGRRLLEEFLTELRVNGDLVGDDSERSNEEQVLRRSLTRYGWYLDSEGFLKTSAGIDVETHGREALEESLERLRRSTSDPALLIGTAKDLLESVAKFVLEEHGMLPPNPTFNHAWYLARERLGILPERVDPNLPGHKAIKKIHGSTWTIAEQINELRNLQGTGHGHTLPTGISEDLALLVVREACSVAEYMLNLLERSHGR